MRHFGFGKSGFGFRRLGFSENPDADIEAIFTNGRQGVWYDPSDISTLFQDVAMTIPVTKDGDPIRVIKDKSGNGHHAVAPSSSARPIYRTDGVLHWFETDGIDDYLKTVFSQVIAQPFTISLGAQVDAIAGNWNYVLDSAGSSNRVYIAKDRTEIYNIGAGVTYKDVDMSLFQRSVLSLQCSGINSSLLVNNTTKKPINVGVNSTGGVSLGANYLGNDTTKVKYYGVIFAIISDTERRSISAYLAKKSGVLL